MAKIITHFNLLRLPPHQFIIFCKKIPPHFILLTIDLSRYGSNIKKSAWNTISLNKYNSAWGNFESMFQFSTPWNFGKLQVVFWGFQEIHYWNFGSKWVKLIALSNWTLSRNYSLILQFFHCKWQGKYTHIVVAHWDHTSLVHPLPSNPQLLPTLPNLWII